MEGNHILFIHNYKKIPLSHYKAIFITKTQLCRLQQQFKEHYRVLLAQSCEQREEISSKVQIWCTSPLSETDFGRHVQRNGIKVYAFHDSVNHLWTRLWIPWASIKALTRCTALLLLRLPAQGASLRGQIALCIFMAEFTSGKWSPLGLGNTKAGV